MATPVNEPSPPAAPYGATREALFNLPNTVTLLRTAAVPVLLAFPWFHSRSASLIIAWCFIAAATTDLIDGWLARRGAQVTRIGQLLDPLVDKLLVSTALIVLLVVGRIPVWGTLMVVVIIGRELAVTGLRGFASAEGRIVAADRAGKYKTLLQNIAIGALLFPDPLLGLPAHTVGMAFLLAATGLTLWSGYRYFAHFFASR